MKRFFLITIAILVLFTIVNGQEIFDFVPSTAGYFIVLRNTGATLDTLKNTTNFFGAYLGDDGFGAERALYGIIDAAGYNAEVDTSILKNAINNDILLAGEELRLKLEDLLTFDPFFVLEKLKSSNTKIFIVWKTENPKALIRAIGALLSMKPFEQQGDTIYELRSNGGELFYYFEDDFLVIGGTRDSITTARKTYNGENPKLLNNGEHGMKAVELSDSYWLTGYFEGDRFKVDLGLQSPYSAKDTVITVRPEDHTLTATIDQNTVFLDKIELDKLTSAVDSKEYESSQLSFGDYTVFFPSSSIETLRNELSHWFELDLEQYNELADFIVSVSRESHGNARIYGDLVAATPTVSVVFNVENVEKTDLKKNIISWGAVESLIDGNKVYEVTNSETTLYFILNKSEVIITTVNPATYFETIKRTLPLKLNRSYQYIRERGLETDLAEGFIDTGKIFKSLIGVSIDSAVLYQQTIDASGTITYTVRVF